MNSPDFYSLFAKEGGGVGWGSPRTESGGGKGGAGQGGTGRCAR